MKQHAVRKNDFAKAGVRGYDASHIPPQKPELDPSSANESQ